MKNLSASEILDVANRFVRRAQNMSMSFSADKMKSEIDRVVGKGIKDLVTEFLNTKPISSAQVNIVYDPSGPRTNFTAYTNNEKVGQELSQTLTNKFAPKISPIVARYQKDKPLDYKYLEMEV